MSEDAVASGVFLLLLGTGGLGLENTGGFGLENAAGVALLAGASTGLEGGVLRGCEGESTVHGGVGRHRGGGAEEDNFVAHGMVR